MLSKNTKQMIISGVAIAFVTGGSTLILSQSALQENHEVRITHLEKNQVQQDGNIKVLAAEVGTLRTEAATVVTMLSTLEKNAQQIELTTQSLEKIVARLDERTKDD